jgi:GH15 family glucan-1,4-alpha-glucosidase
MIPEQVFEHNGVGTGAATPLAWSHAESLVIGIKKEYRKCT